MVFGINTFLGTILKSIIILIFADKRGLALDVRSQVKKKWFLFVASVSEQVLGSELASLALHSDTHGISLRSNVTLFTKHTGQHSN